MIVMYEPTATVVTTALRKLVIGYDKYESPADLAHKEEFTPSHAVAAEWICADHEDPLAAGAGCHRAASEDIPPRSVCLAFARRGVKASTGHEVTTLRVLHLIDISPMAVPSDSAGTRQGIPSGY